MTTFTIRQGDTHRRLALTLTDITTTGATSVRFRMRSQNGGALKVDNDGVIDSASQVSYQFTAGQLDTPGVYDLEAALQYGDGPETVPTAGFVTVVVQSTLG